MKNLQEAAEANSSDDEAAENGDEDQALNYCFLGGFIVLIKFHPFWTDLTHIFFLKVAILVLIVNVFFLLKLTGGCRGQLL